MSKNNLKHLAKGIGSILNPTPYFSTKFYEIEPLKLDDNQGVNQSINKYWSSVGGYFYKAKDD